MQALKIQAALNTWEDAQAAFEYGKTDCCKFVAHVLSELHGVDYFPHELVYSSKEQADEHIDDAGSLTDLVARYLGEPDGDASLGCPVIAELPIVGETLGVRVPGGAVVPKEKSGLLFVSDRYLTAGWEIK